jgi:hypothetical protein
MCAAPQIINEIGKDVKMMEGKYVGTIKSYRKDSSSER